MLIIKTFFLLSVFIFLAGFNGLKAMGHDELVKAMGQAGATGQAEATGQTEATGQADDLVGEDCGQLDDPTTKHQSEFCNTFVVFAKQLLPPNVVLGYIPDCVYKQNIEEGKLMDPKEFRNYDFQMAHNAEGAKPFQVTKNYEKIQEGKIYLFTKQGNPIGDRGLKMVREIKDLVSGTTIIPCEGG